MICPDLGVGVVVLGNVRSHEHGEDSAPDYRSLSWGPVGADSANREQGADGESGGRAKTDAAPFLDIDSVKIENFMGGYRLEADPSMLAAIAREGEYLVGLMAGVGTGLFKPVAPFVFETEARDTRLTFSRNNGSEGPSESVIISLKGRDMAAKRVRLPSDGRWIGECVGRYDSDELGAVWEIVRESGSGLTVRIGIGSEGRTVIPVDADILMGGIGMLTFLRDGNGSVIGFDFGSPRIWASG